MASMPSRLRTLLFGGLLATCITPASAEQCDSPLNQNTLTLMHTLKQDYNLPSFSLAISVDENIVFAEAIGHANIEANLKATHTTRYSVGSVAKAMTGIALARLLDEQKVQLDTPITRYLPNYPEHGQAITIRHLASHTSGTGRPWAVRNTLEFDQVSDHASPLPVIDKFSDDALEFPPGSDFAYTSAGYITLSGVMEAAAQRPYTELMSTMFNDLGMKDSHHDTSRYRDARQATYYTFDTANQRYLTNTVRRDRSFLFGGGGFISTPSDLVRLSHSMFKQDYLSESAKRELLRAVPLYNGDINPQFYSLGWRVHRSTKLQYQGEPVLMMHHGGVTNDAATAFLMIFPELQAAIAYATNIEPEKHWQMRPHMATLLLSYINQQNCQHEHDLRWLSAPM